MTCKNIDCYCFRVGIVQQNEYKYSILGEHSFSCCWTARDQHFSLDWATAAYHWWLRIRGRKDEAKGPSVLSRRASDGALRSSSFNQPAPRWCRVVRAPSSSSIVLFSPCECATTPFNGAVCGLWIIAILINSDKSARNKNNEKTRIGSAKQDSLGERLFVIYVNTLVVSWLETWRLPAQY